jgi:hypothetical protein
MHNCFSIRVTRRFDGVHRSPSLVLIWSQLNPPHSLSRHIYFRRHCRCLHSYEASQCGCPALACEPTLLLTGTWKPLDGSRTQVTVILFVPSSIHPSKSRGTGRPYTSKPWLRHDFLYHSAYTISVLDKIWQSTEASKPAIRHNSETVPSISHPHNLFT